MIDINELRRLAQAATPGPWVATTVVTSVGVCHKVGPFPGKTVEHPPRHACMYVDYESVSNPADREIYVNAAFIAAANPAAISELLDRLEEAEAEALEQARLNGMGSEREAALMAKLEAAERKCDVEQRRARDLQMQCCDLIAEVDALRAKIEAMEKQEPVAFALYSGWALKSTYLKEHEACEQRDRRQLTADLGGSLEAYRVVPLYTLLGAKGEEK